MADFEPHSEAKARAGKLSARLARDLRVVAQERPEVGFRRQVFPEAHYRDAAAGATIRDVADDVADMAKRVCPKPSHGWRDSVCDV